MNKLLTLGGNFVALTHEYAEAERRNGWLTHLFETLAHGSAEAGLRRSARVVVGAATDPRLWDLHAPSA
jgi:hypothetical protein